MPVDSEAARTPLERSAAAPSCVLSPGLHAAGTVPLLLLHGAAGSARHWSGVVDELPPWVAPIALDLPGHGASCAAVPDTLDEAVERIAEALRQIGPGEPLAVAGHSIGGLVALQLAASRPELVSHLVLVASAARISPHPGLLRQLAQGEIDEEFLLSAFSAAVPADRRQLVVEDARRTRLPPHATDFMGVRDVDLHPRLGSLRAATLVVIARGDPVVSPRKSRATAAAIPGSTQVVLDSGHYIPIERPAELASVLADFLAAPGQTSGGRP